MCLKASDTLTGLFVWYLTFSFRFPYSEILLLDKSIKFVCSIIMLFSSSLHLSGSQVFTILFVFEINSSMLGFWAFMLNASSNYCKSFLLLANTVASSA